MRTAINIRRLADKLRRFEFALASNDQVSGLWFSRPSELPQLWERICVQIAGTRGENVGIDAGASVCYGAISARWLHEGRFVWETGTPKEPDSGHVDGSRILRNKDEADEWETMVASVAPAKTRCFALERGPELLKRTMDDRSAVDRYLKLFGTSDWRVLRAKAAKRASANDLAEARRIALTPPTIQIRNGLEFYVAIILGIRLHSPEVEGRQLVAPGVLPWPGPVGGNWDKQPSDWTEWGLAWRIEMLADRMLANYPETMPSALPADE